MILGCAAVETVPDVVALVAVPALVENVAFATVPVTFAPVIALKPEPSPTTVVNIALLAPILPTLALPVTDRTPPVTKLAPVTLPVAVNIDVPILPILALPLIDNDVNVPTLVMFGWALVVTVPAVVAVPALVENVAFATVPVTLAPVIDDKPAPEPKCVAFILPAVMLDVTAKLPKVPTDVMFG